MSAAATSSAPAAALDAMEQRHGFRGRRRLVEERRVRDGKSREVDDRRLEVDQRLEAALRDLGLVGRVLRVPAGVLQEVPLDHPRGETAVVSHAEKRAEDPILLRALAELREGRALPEGRRQVERLAEPNARGDRLLHEGVQGVPSQEGQHFAHVLLGRPDVATGKGVPGLPGDPGHGGPHCNRGVRGPVQKGRAHYFASLST